jgi:NADPH-ferrihemoprotein reductase
MVSIGRQVLEVDGPVTVLAPASVPAYAVEVLSGAAAVEATRLLPGVGRGTGLSAGSPFMARVLDVRELHGSASDRSCLHVELDVTGSQVRRRLAVA